MLAAFLVTIFFSFSAICGHRSARLLGGTTANFARLLLAALLLGLWAHSLGQGLSGPSLSTFFLSGCVGFGMGDVAFYQALLRIGSRLTSLIVQCLAAPLAALIEWIWLGTTLSPAQMISAAVILTGVALALSPVRNRTEGGVGRSPRGAGREAAFNSGKGRAASLLSVSVFGIGWALVASFGQGFGAVLSRKAFAMAGASGLSIDGATSAYQRVLGGVVVGGVAWAIVRWRHRANNHFVPLPKAERRRAIQWMTLNAVSGAVLGVSCFQWALSSQPSGIVLPIVATTPLVVIPFAYFFENDKPTSKSILGGIVAVTGAILLTVVS